MFSGKPLRWKLPFNKVAGLEFIASIYLKTSSTTGFLEWALQENFFKKIRKILCNSFSIKVTGFQSISCIFTETYLAKLYRTNFFPSPSRVFSYANRVKLD